MGSELDRTHDPSVTSWVASARDHPDFPHPEPAAGGCPPAGRGAPGPGRIRIGDEVLGLAGLAGSGLLSGAAQQAAEAGSGSDAQPAVRPGGRAAAGAPQRGARAAGRRSGRGRVGCPRCCSPRPRSRCCCRREIGDYTDFYAGIHHAVHVGALFRPDNPLLPNYKWVPIGYHGRASTVQVSGVPFRRPKGQRLPAPDAPPVYEPTRRLDLELELGIWIGPGNEQGEPIPIGSGR